MEFFNIDCGSTFSFKYEEGDTGLYLEGRMDCYKGKKVRGRRKMMKAMKKVLKREYGIK